MCNWNTLRDFFTQSGLPLLEARMLVEEVLQVNRAWMMAHDDEPLTAHQVERLKILSSRRLAGEPMAYIMGSREFMGLNFSVSPAVLIPRPDTEVLVETALTYLKIRMQEITRSPRILDMGTGSGAIAISLAHYCPKAEVYASDISVEAIAIAQQNAEQLGVKVHFLHSDWFENVVIAKEGGCNKGEVLQNKQECFDLIVSNPPYIHAEDEHLEQGDLRFEPQIALTDFQDGLSAYRTIIQQAPHYLGEGGALWVEHGWDQAEQVRYLLHQRGFSCVESRKDLASIERISGGIWQKSVE